MQDIKFKNNVAYKGKKWATATGLEVLKTETIDRPSPNGIFVLNISPTNKNGRSSMELEIPIEHLGEVMLAMMKESNTDPFIGLHEDIFQLASMYGHWSASNDPETVFTGGSGQAMGDVIQWAKEFNKKNAGREWDGEWYDEIEEFFNEKINSPK